MCIQCINKHILEWGWLPSCLMEKSIPIAAGMESLLEAGSQSVSINSHPHAQDFHSTDAFCIVKHPGMWAAWIHVFAPSFISPFPGKAQSLWGPCAHCTCFPFHVSANKWEGSLTGYLTCITDISLDKWMLLPLGIQNLNDLQTVLGTPSG
jgi:hypothetical protein